MDADLWTPEARRAFIACAIDTDGWVGLRIDRRPTGALRFTAMVGVCNQNRDLLQHFADCAGVPPRFGTNSKPGTDHRGIVTRRHTWQSDYRSPLHVVPILTLALPYLIAKRERAEWVLEFAQSRITPSGKVYRRGRMYTERDHELARLVSAANGRGSRHLAAVGCTSEEN